MLALFAAGALILLAWGAPVRAAPAPAAPAATPLPAAPPANLTAKDWVVADADTGAILAASHLHDQDMPASTMKILTALTILPSLPQSQIVTVGEDASRVDGTKVGLVPGVGYPVRDLATAMLIASGNDATVTLVDASGGSAAVLQRMNALAVSLGARDTVAGDPTGLDSPGQLTSVHDLAVFGRAAIHEPNVRQYLTIRRASLPGRGDQRFEIQNHNLLLGRYDGTIGVKNGYTVAAGATFVGAATRAGRTLVVALLRTAPEFDRDARALLDWGFAHDGQITPVGYLPNAAGQGADGATAADGAAPASAGRTAPSAAALPAPRVGEHGGILTGIGPTTWIALGLTAAACLVTVVTRRVGRRARRARAVRSAAMRTRFTRTGPGRADRPARPEPVPVREQRPARPGSRAARPSADRRSGPASPGRRTEPVTAPVRRLPTHPDPGRDTTRHWPERSPRPGPERAAGQPYADLVDDDYADGYGRSSNRGVDAYTDELYYELPPELPYEVPPRRRT
ncbi:D-alanyl-D-alanine carboxypeptidase family protein [Frankia sp. R82]|uniref:D-alanyl-D-alanine carboxypeptidase family protein n=1 Tax=Frankia sp. R82 TaxID=2950553 RepID=UPI0020449707|nr:serine hydrolase [Frankia sp. R82]MCM3882938.1 serine hydrolase [Frankia sp. R82]